MFSTHPGGTLRLSDEGKTVNLSGWVNRRRDHGDLIFVDLRDRSGLVQVVFNPDISAETHQQAVPLRSEWVIQVEGIVRQRPAGMENPNLATGEIEVEVQ
jgi:aspartyl-tRNA synthetase